MAHSPRPGRLVAVLGPPRPALGPESDTRTEPIPVVPGPGLLARLVPESLRGSRIRPGRPGAVTLVVVAAAAAVLAAVGVWTARPQVEPVSALPVVGVSEAAPVDPTSTDPDAAPGPGGSDSAAADSAAADPGAPLVVSVSGRVQRPGLVEVPDGARVADVLTAAGGALPGTDLAALNLARRVADGEQIAVGVPAAPDAAGTGAAPPGDGAAPTPGGKIDLNTATAEQLDSLPGVGPVTVERLLAWRAGHGRFTRVDQLREIEGIGERRFGQLRDLVTV